ncbi:hypothetical protein CH282_15775 [Rhodococcus sp. 06-418-1B]|nr:helix-turn-helix transcriptional regulator [Rhodococcus sp. 06-418-1B]OZC83417.1 hypothetical protein CH282_15775 [Rhodococcus sp. 06-418-1B]
MTEEDRNQSEGLQMPQSGVRGFSPSALDAAMSRKRASNDDLADAIGVSRQSVAAWRSGRAIPTAVLLRKAASWLTVAVADLVPIDDERLRISDLRIRVGLTQRMAATDLGLNPTAVAEIEKGRRSFSDEVATSMASLYRTDVDAVRMAWERTNAARKARLDSM